MKGKDGGAAKVLRREWALRRLPRWGRGVRRRAALRALRPSLNLRTVTSLRNVPMLRMAYLNKRATCALLFKTLMLQVRRAHPTPSHRNAPSGHSGVPVGLFYAKSTQYSLLQNARPSGSLRSPYGCLRTVTSLRNVPVLRMAYLNKRATSALLFKTLMLQVRCAHPTGTGELRIPSSPFTAGAGTSEKEMRQKTEGRSAEKLLK